MAVFPEPQVSAIGAAADPVGAVMSRTGSWLMQPWRSSLSLATLDVRAASFEAGPLSFP